MQAEVTRSSPALNPPPLEFLRAGLCPLWVVLHCWVGLRRLPIAGPADPTLRAKIAFKELFLATSTEIGSRCFASGLLNYDATVVLHILSSCLHSFS